VSFLSRLLIDSSVLQKAFVMTASVLVCSIDARMCSESCHRLSVQTATLPVQSALVSLAECNSSCVKGHVFENALQRCGPKRKVLLLRNAISISAATATACTMASGWTDKVSLVVTTYAPCNLCRIYLATKVFAPIGAKYCEEHQHFSLLK
jgi:hypothetical protein